MLLRMLIKFDVRIISKFIRIVVCHRSDPKPDKGRVVHAEKFVPESEATTSDETMCLTAMAVSELDIMR